MLNIIFEFVGGPNDGKLVEGKLGEPSDAERHYLFSDHGRIGQRFSVASEYAVEALTSDAKDLIQSIQRHYYVVTDRLEDGQDVWVRAQYVPAAAADADEDEFAEQAEHPEDDFCLPGTKLDGQLLIASPHLTDEWFSEAVVLVLDQNEEETFGIILNRPTSETVDQLWAQVSDLPCENEDQVFVGGPEDGPVLILHTDDSASSLPAAPGVHVTIDKDDIERLVSQGHIQQRMFVGTASWSPQQLESELAMGDWLILPASKDLVFSDAEAMWKMSLQELGRQFLRRIGIKHIPDDPAAN